MYYRGVDYMFWNDFLRHGWGDFDFAKYTALGKPVVGPGGHEVQNEIIRTSAWTWITGDQHLSNFGAWRNRAGEVVFGVNDFDEAVIYDFQMDVWRLAVSIYDHAITNDYSAAEAIGAVVAFTEAYVATLEGYVGNEKALLFEMTAEHASGPLREFLEATASRNSAAEQLRVFTRVGSSGEREFIKDDSTKLAEVEPSVREEILSGWTAAGYGATLNKIGWHEIEFSPEFFRVIDMAKRIGSGDGSFGAARYYLLIAGGDRMRPNEPNVILDVKSTPEPAMRRQLAEADAAWYGTLFHNEGSRTNLAQRALTSFTDPYTGWISLGGEILSIRERSPWKASFDIDSLKSLPEFLEFVKQTAVVTATSHARGTVGHSPAAFKEVVVSVLGPKAARDAWGANVATIAAGYRQQLAFDFKCFREWVLATYPDNADIILSGNARAIRKHFIRKWPKHWHSISDDDDESMDDE